MRTPIIASVAAAAAVALAAAQQSSAATTPPTANVTTIVSQLEQRMDAVSAYSAHIKLAVQLHSFPFIAANLDGTTTYTRPGHYTVTFEQLPSLASAFQRVSGDVGDPAAWSQKYNIAIDPDASTGESLALRLTERTKGQVDHALAYVDLASHTVTRMEWYYVNGGRIAMDQHFAPIDGVLLVDSQAADIDMPGYKATANAVFDGYDVHVGSTGHTVPATR